jgi:hypothetical protein
MRELLVVALGAALLVGCGGSGRTATPTSVSDTPFSVSDTPTSVSDTPTATEATATPPDLVLHLGSSDITESAFRQQTRASLMGSGNDAFCLDLPGLSDEEAAAAIIEDQGSPTVTPMAPGASLPADWIRAVAIVREECARLLNGS